MNKSRILAGVIIEASCTRTFFIITKKYIYFYYKQLSLQNNSIMSGNPVQNVTFCSVYWKIFFLFPKNRKQIVQANIRRAVSGNREMKKGFWGCGNFLDRTHGCLKSLAGKNTKRFKPWSGISLSTLGTQVRFCGFCIFQVMQKRVCFPLEFHYESFIFAIYYRILSL